MEDADEEKLAPPETIEINEAFFYLTLYDAHSHVPSRSALRAAPALPRCPF